MPVDVQVRSRMAYGKVQEVIGKLVFSGFYPAGGEPLPFSLLSRGTDKRPIRQMITGASQNNLYLYDDNNQKVIIRTQGTPPAEIAGGAYPASVTGDNIEFNIVFPKV